MQYAVIKDNLVICISDHEPCPDDLATRGEHSILCGTEVTIGYTYDGTKFTPPKPIVTPAPTKESLVSNIRIRRDSLLSASDPMMLSDYPVPEGLARDQWTAKVIAYRQALRDMPESCDPQSPQYPKL